MGLRKSLLIAIGSGLPILMLSITGCGRGYEKYVPASQTAREALTTALTAWKEGQKLRRIETFSPPIEVLDSRWLQGQALRDFQILGEVHQDGPRCFTVQLNLDGPEKQHKVRYYVFGIEPLWICRQEDYDMLNHWSCAGEQDQPIVNPKSENRNSNNQIQALHSKK
jgi:hypothetical protein